MRLNNSEDLYFQFTIIIRQSYTASGNLVNSEEGGTDTQISGLTYVFAPTQKELENLIVREFHSDPNLHKNPNVELVGDYNTAGRPSAQFTWSWKWRPPKVPEDRGGGWRTKCSFAEYNQRAHRLDILATFQIWVQNVHKHLSLAPRSPRMELNLPSRLRVPSAQSIESRVSNISDSEGEGTNKEPKDPQSPVFDAIPEAGLGSAPTSTASAAAFSTPGSAVKVDVATCKSGEEPSTNEDGPLFRATMRSLEQKTGNMRLRMKKVLRTAEAAQLAQKACNQAVEDFSAALRDAASSNQNAVRPALDHYFNSIAKEILQYEKQNTVQLQKLIIDPISKLYNIEIKQADVKKREFDEESKEYYAYVSKYLGQRSESLKEKKQKQSDEKYQSKRRTFELKRFDYSSFMHDLHGGRKDQEVLSQLTKYADAQARGYLATAKKVEELLPRLDALISEVKTADQDFQLQRTEREEKRRILEKSSKLMNEDGFMAPSGLTHSTSQKDTNRAGEMDPAKGSSYSPPLGGPSGVQPGANGAPGASSQPPPTSPKNRFKGIRDLEDPGGSAVNSGTYRKEGLLWALSRPGSHVDPKGINKAAWHKFWIVLDQGMLTEYVNWKDKLDLHIDPMDLRMASVREARNSERRFCFEIITPHFTRVYQAPAEEDMKSWIAAINNALQSAFENRSHIPHSPSPAPPSGSRAKDIAAVLTGKSSSFSGHRQISNPNRQAAEKVMSRHSTVGGSHRPDTATDAAESSLLLHRVRAADEGNKMCADCRSESKVDWCSINLGVLLCIECSGIHRSLGTHISKVRSLTLDTTAFTPDLIEILLLIGNRVSNMVWEATLDPSLRPSPYSSREQRLTFIHAKYAERAFVAPAPAPPDDHLLTSIKRNDVPAVLHALARGASPDAHDRSRHTPAIFLALAAADPAAPSPSLRTSTATPSASSRPTSPPPPVKKPFPVPELLLQNGARLPAANLSPFPLSDTAKGYLDAKAEARRGVSLGSAFGLGGPSGDQLSSLPENSPTGISGGAGSRDRPPTGGKRHSAGYNYGMGLAGATKGVVESLVKK